MIFGTLAYTERGVFVRTCHGLKLLNPLCVSLLPLFSSPLQHAKHTHTHAHSNRWLILTEIIRQQSHQHGSVVIRVWTQCLFSSRNGSSAWRKRKEMHYSPWCPDPIQRHMVAPSSFFSLSLKLTKNISSLPPQHSFSPLDLIHPGFYFWSGTAI